MTSTHSIFTVFYYDFPNSPVIEGSALYTHNSSVPMSLYYHPQDNGGSNDGLRSGSWVCIRYFARRLKLRHRIADVDTGLFVDMAVRQRARQGSGYADGVKEYTKLTIPMSLE
ncbi:uncharacterized protein ARMOST_15148 [Armillaria ostoyae]|uniref:Uncharacterized protein n=1 Tax=Armillaria ostoyae TaxID=47428 RepID=A0A284RSL9_ARMOS|nr:uncharacterized protein ARMOST_15148 [Armillaria ostoyae]